jgi:glycosyltransferase involved in cell wall biosynthesis
MNPPKISVVLGAYNQKPILEKVLSAYAKQSVSGEHFEVIVVDSTSPDGTGDWFKTLQLPFHFNGIVQENKGKAAARNRGVKDSRSELIIITDSDMIPHKDFIKLHLEAHARTTGPACFEGVTLNMTELQWPIQNPNILYPYIRENLKDGAKLGWWYFLTGNISFPKSLFNQFNGFDETFAGYGWEDLELGYRFKKAGIPLYFLKNCLNYHYHVVTEDEEIERNIKKGESALIFLKKHPELKWFLGLNPLSVAIRRRLKSGGRIEQFIRKRCYASKNPKLHGFGFWFLKEFNYLTGILKLV